MSQIPVTIAERVQVTSTDALFARVPAEVVDLVVVAQTSRRSWRLVAKLRDGMKMAAKLLPSSLTHIVMRDTVKLQVALTTRLSAVLHAGFRVRTFLTVAQGVLLRDTVKVRTAGRAQATYRRALASRTRITDRLPTMKLGGLLRDLAQFAATALGLRKAVAVAHEEVEISDALACVLQLVVFVEDAVELSTEALLLAIYNGVLSDRMDFVLDVVDDAGDVTTWAMNVRTGAVTEYLNHAFNSYTRSAPGTYLAAGSDGLFELVGDDDEGAPVVADIIGGLVDFSGPFLSSLQAAYIAIRGDGTFYLKLTQGDGKRSTVYEVRPRSLRTSRVNIGKGLRATYFTWQLVSTGQDFDLMSLDFLPVQQTRRI